MKDGVSTSIADCNFFIFKRWPRITYKCQNKSGLPWEGFSRFWTPFPRFMSIWPTIYTFLLQGSYRQGIKYNILYHTYGIYIHINDTVVLKKSQNNHLGCFVNPGKKDGIFTQKQLVQDFYPPRENSFPLRLVTNTGKQLENGGALMRKFLSWVFCWAREAWGWSNLACLRSVILMHFCWGTKKSWRFWKF